MTLFFSSISQAVSSRFVLCIPTNPHMECRASFNWLIWCTFLKIVAVNSCTISRFRQYSERLGCDMNKSKGLLSFGYRSCRSSVCVWNHRYGFGLSTVVIVRSALNHRSGYSWQSWLSKGFGCEGLNTPHPWNRWVNRHKILSRHYGFWE